MADISTGINIDTSGVERARDRLKEAGAAGASAGAGFKSAESASQQMSRQMEAMTQQINRTNQLLQQTHDTLRNGSIHTNSYADSLLKVATAAGAVTLAYKGMKEALDLSIQGMNEQLSVMQKINVAAQSFGRYGADAFKLMRDEAVAAQAAIAGVANSVGATTTQLQAATARAGGAGVGSQQATGMFAYVQNALTTNSAEAQRARQVMAQFGVSTSGSPDEVMARAFSALQGTQAGPQRNAAANAMLGPGGADALNQAFLKFGEVTEFEARNLRDRDRIVRMEEDAARRRQAADEASIAAYEKSPVLAGIAALFSSSGSPSDIVQSRTNELVKQTGTLGLGQLRAAFGPTFSSDDFFGGLKKIGQSFATFVTGGLYRPAEDVGLPGTAGGGAARVPVDFAAQAAGLAAGGSPQEQQIRGLQQTWEQLLGDAEKLGLSSQQLDTIWKNLSSAMTQIQDPMHQTLVNLRNAASLAGVAPGPQRTIEESLRSSGAAVARSRGLSEAAISQMGAEELKGFLSSGQTAELSNASAAPYLAGRGFEVRGAQSQAQAAQASAAAAINGPVAALRASIAVHEKYQESLTIAADKANVAAISQAQLAETLAAYARAGNEAARDARLEQQRVLATPAPVGGRRGAAGYLAQAQFAAVRQRPDLFENLGDVPLNAQGVQTNLTQTGAGLTDRLDTTLQRIQEMAQRLTQQTDLSGSSGATHQMRQMLQLDVLQKDIQDVSEAMSKAGMAANPMIDHFKQLDTEIEKAAKGLADAQLAQNVKRYNQEISKELGPLQAELAARQAGAGPDDIAIAQRTAIERQRQSDAGILGKAGVPDPGAVAQQYVELKNNLEDLKKEQDLWNGTIKNSIDVLGNGIEALVYMSDRGKNVQNALKGMATDISKQGFNYFFKSPGETLMSNLLGIGGQSGSHASFGASGSGFMSWLGGMFGGGGGGAGGALAGISSTNPLPVTVVGANPTGMAGDFSGGGSLMGGGSSGAANDNGAFGKLGSWFGSLFSSGGGGSSGASAWGSDALGTEFAGAGFANGGIVGVHGSPRMLNSSWFAGAPRFGAGGMVGLNPGEVPIIAHYGEVILNPKQQKQMKGGTTVNVNMPVTTGNVDGFRYSSGQLAANMAKHVERQTKRYS